MVVEITIRRIDKEARKHQPPQPLPKASQPQQQTHSIAEPILPNPDIQLCISRLPHLRLGGYGASEEGEMGRKQGTGVAVFHEANHPCVPCESGCAGVQQLGAAALWPL